MKNDTQNNADLFEKYTFRSADIEKKLTDLKSQSELSEIDVNTIKELNEELRTINNWFNKTA
jgi:hypothetical protein